MKPKSLMILAIPTFVATAACAQHGEKMGRMGQLPIVVAVDADRDAVISVAEVERASTALLTLDQDKDGKLSKDEYLPKGHQIPVVLPIVAALDANGDEVIDANEIARAATALKSLDKNGDGKISREELAPKH